MVIKYGVKEWNTIYEGMIEEQLNIAYKKHGFGILERSDYRANLKNVVKMYLMSIIDYPEFLISLLKFGFH